MESSRHELRKRLKLLKIDNMKLKKRLRLVTRVRTLNRNRLEDEIVQLNSILSTIKSKLTGAEEGESSFGNPQSSACKDMTGKGAKAEYKYFCDKCTFKAKKKTQLEVHIKRHDGVKAFACAVCRKRFVAKYELKAHMGRHSGEKALRCSLCEYITYRADLLIHHTESHYDFKLLQCEKCNFKTNDRSKLEIHNERHSSNNSLQCDACNLAAKHKNKSIDENDEGLQHTCKKLWKCDLCEKSFRKKESLKKHSRTHSGERPYACDSCDYAAATKHTLMIHRRKHTGDKPYACDKCSFRCTTRGYLKIHLNKHDGVKPFACDQCEYRSVDSCKLSTHRKIHHNDEKPYSCEKCPFRTKLHSRLKQHALIHGLRSFVCSYCAKKFTTKRSLVEHEGIHNGNQPYVCTICKTQNRFTLEVTYKRHMNAHRLKFSCDQCCYKAAFAKDLRRHSKVHLNKSYRPRKTSQRTLQCSNCKFRCVQQTSLFKHMRTNHVMNPDTDASLPQSSEVTAASSTPVSEKDCHPVVADQQINSSHSLLILNIPNAHFIHANVKVQDQAHQFGDAVAQPPVHVNYGYAMPFSNLLQNQYHPVYSVGAALIADRSNDISETNNQLIGRKETDDGKIVEYNYSDINYLKQ